MTSEQLAERMQRDRRTYLRSLGYESEEELRAAQQRERERQEAEENARREQQTREQNLQEDLERERQRAAAAEAARDRLQFETEVTTLCATVGVRNVDYALHLVDRARQEATEGESVDVEAFLRERIDPENEAHQQTRLALGIEAAPTTTPAPATTTRAGGPTPTPPPAGGGGGGEEDAFEMDAQAWQAKKEAMGIS